jgi:hypothetical protein
MNKMTKIVGATLGGVAGGFALALILCGATVIVAIATGSGATLPGVFSATAGTENDALALEFEPNLVGILVVVALCALASGAMVALAPGNRLRPSGGRQ